MSVKYLNNDGEIFEGEYDVSIARHTSAHVMAQAIKRMYPEATLAIGPAIENGFYYDIDNVVIKEEDLEKIENEMNKIIKENLKMETFILPYEEAKELMKNEPYKLEMIEELGKDAKISFFKQGEFVDMCVGPHFLYISGIGKVKLFSSTGAYWRGDEKNKMLTRIYGTTFKTKEELDAEILRREEAKKRDHKKLGKELGLFMIAPEGPGFPFFLPKGMDLRNTLEEFWRHIHKENGYVEIKTPIILNEELWHRSGHWDHYKDNMYTTKIDDTDYGIKPMNCPGGMIVYKSNLHSYKELPIRMGELGLVHRHEKSGELNGLFRVRCFTQDDAHIFCMPSQIEDEIKGVIKLIDRVYSMFGFEYTIELSTRPEDSMGSDELWEMAEGALKNVLKNLGRDYVLNEGDGAFYGPKIDFHIKDCLGRDWQCGTIQLDFQMPERFDLTYIGEDGEKHRPVMLHRVIFGSIERFIGILTEHFAGAFPLWISPVQVSILPISENELEYANILKEKLEAYHYRVDIDSSSEKIGYKIRNAQLQKVNYMVVLGKNEVENNTVSVRSRDGSKKDGISVDELISDLNEEMKKDLN